MAKKKSKKNGNVVNLGFEATLWAAADKLRNNMDAAEYKHVVLGLIFLKYISDAFTELHEKLLAGEGEYEGAARRVPTNISPKGCSGCRRKPVGRICKRMPNNRPSAS